MYNGPIHPGQVVRAQWPAVDAIHRVNGITLGKAGSGDVWVVTDVKVTPMANEIRCCFSEEEFREMAEICLPPPAPTAPLQTN